MAKKNKKHNDSLKKLTFEKEALEQNMDFMKIEVVTLQSEAKDKAKQLDSLKKPQSLRKDVYTIDPPQASPTCYSCGRSGHLATLVQSYSKYFLELANGYRRHFV